MNRNFKCNQEHAHAWIPSCDTTRIPHYGFNDMILMTVKPAHKHRFNNKIRFVNLSSFENNLIMDVLQSSKIFY